jgi:hypothetical protein
MEIFSRLGVRASLILAFVGISGFAVLATVAAMYSFKVVQTSFDLKSSKGFDCRAE